MFIESHLAWTVERLMILEHKIENTIGSVGMTPASFGQVMGDMKNIEKKVSCILMNVCNVKLKIFLSPSFFNEYRIEGETSYTFRKIVIFTDMCSLNDHN